MEKKNFRRLPFFRKKTAKPATAGSDLPLFKTVPDNQPPCPSEPLLPQERGRRGEEEVADPKPGTQQEEITTGSTAHNLPEVRAPPHGLLHTVPATLSSRLNSWEGITSDQTVLGIVEVVRLDFSSLPFHIRCPYPVPFIRSEHLLMTMLS